MGTLHHLAEALQLGCEHGAPQPHIHAIVSRGVWTPDGQWLPIPYVDAYRAELVFRHKLLGRLRNAGLLSQERIELLLSWQHSGFSVHNHTTVYPTDTEGIHRLACYLMRAPVNLSRLRFDEASGLLVYEPRAGQGVEDRALVDPLEFVARVLIHIPQHHKHLVHFYGAYANRVRADYQRAHTKRRDVSSPEPAPPRLRVRKRWAELIHSKNLGPPKTQALATTSSADTPRDPPSLS